MHLLDDIIDKMIREIFRKMKGVSKNDLVQARYAKELTLRKTHMTAVKAELAKATETLNVLRAEIVRCIQGESAFSQDTLAGLIQDSEIKCSELQKQYEEAEAAVLSEQQYIQQFVKNTPDDTIVAIPIHGSCAQIHDAITRANGSFQQTKRGIQQLLKHNIRVEIRLVVSKLNVNDFDNLANLIIDQFKDIAYVSVIAMEMTGNARVNQELVWMPYGESFAAISGAIRKLVSKALSTLSRFSVSSASPYHVSGYLFLSD